MLHTKKNTISKENPLHILFRSCIPIHSIRSGNRPFNATKRNVVLCCLQSLLNSVTNICTIHILDDHSQQEDLESMTSMLNLNSNRHQLISIPTKGNGLSLETTFNYAKENAFPFIYFCEDDYLHLPHSIEHMINFYNHFTKDCIIHPTDYIDRYNRDSPSPSLIYLGPSCHWRTIQHTTGTFLISQKILQKYWKKYIAFAKINKTNTSGGEDKTINKIYKKETCVSPIPSLAAHFSPHPDMPKFIDWKNLYQQMKEQIQI